jgi:putative NADH-flavin reductase
MKEIANRGHQVTVISPNAPNNPSSNYKIINPNDVTEDSDGNYLINCEKYGQWGV